MSSSRATVSAASWFAVAGGATEARERSSAVQRRCQPDDRQQRMRERAAALERGLDARCDTPVAARARRRLLVDETRQAERLHDLRVAPAVRLQQRGSGQRLVNGT